MPMLISAGGGKRELKRFPDLKYTWLHLKDSTAALFTFVSAITPQLLNLIHYKNSPRVLLHPDTRKGHLSLLPVAMSHLNTASLTELFSIPPPGKKEVGWLHDELPSESRLKVVNCLAGFHIK